MSDWDKFKKAGAWEQFKSLEPSEEEQVREPTETRVRGTYLPIETTYRDGKNVGTDLAVPGVIKSMVEAVEAPGKALMGSGGDYLPGAQPDEAQAANVAMNVAPFMKSPGGALGARRPTIVEMARSKLQVEKALQAEMDDTLAAGRAEKLVAYPDNTYGKTALALGGKTPMRAVIRDRNLPQYDRMSREEASLGPLDRLNRETLKAKRTELAAPYRELAQISPKAGKLWQEVQDLRVEANDAWAKARSNEDRAAARALDQQALDKEVQIDKIAQMNFKPDQLSKLRNARSLLAKNYMVSEAVIEGTGHVDPTVYQKALNNERFMTGKLDLMARFKNAETFAMEKMKEEGGMLHGGVGGHLLGKAGGGVYYPGIPYLGGKARNIALGNVGQRPPSYEPGLGVKVRAGAGAAFPYLYPRPASPSEVEQTQKKLRQATALGYPAMLNMLESEQ